MRNRIVMWGSDANESKILLAMDLVTAENKVNTYIFNENVATEAFYKQMMSEWREGKELTFPEHQSSEKDLAVAEDLLPEGIRVEKHDVILRAKTEWHFMVLSSKMYQMFKSELEEFEGKVKEVTSFDKSLWDELVTFWDKVQKQLIDKNLFREHGRNLKEKTNVLFDDLKKMRKSLDAEFKKASKSELEKLVSKLVVIEEKVEKGLGLKPIFEELKQLHQESKEARMTRNDRSKIWDKIDAAFKVVKEKRGVKGGGNHQGGVSRIKRRMDGLLNAINKMEQSIKRDLKDKEFENRRMAATNGQLEMQIRQAKLKMIEERIRSKEEKLKDMHLTRKDLEKKMAKEEKKDARKIEVQKVEKKKEEIKAKIAKDIEEKNANLGLDSDKIEKAAAEIKESKAPKGDNLIEAISATVGDALENVVDTVKAVAEVVEDRIEETLESLKEEE